VHLAGIVFCDCSTWLSIWLAPRPSGRYERPRGAGQ